MADEYFWRDTRDDEVFRERTCSTCERLRGELCPFPFDGGSVICQRYVRKSSASTQSIRVRSQIALLELCFGDEEVERGE